MADSAPVKWMQGMHMKKGALRDTAKRMGLITGGEALSSSDLSKLARSDSPKTRKRAALAKVFKAAHH